MQCRENEVQATVGLIRESVVLFLSKITLRAENDFLKGDLNAEKYYQDYAEGLPLKIFICDFFSCMTELGHIICNTMQTGIGQSSWFSGFTVLQQVDTAQQHRKRKGHVMGNVYV